MKVYRSIKTGKDIQPSFEDYNGGDPERTSSITGKFKSIGFNNKEVNRKKDNEPMVIREVYVNLVQRDGSEAVIKGAISFHYPNLDKTTINYTVLGMLNKLASSEELGKLEFTITKKKNSYITVIERKPDGMDNILYDKFPYEEQKDIPDLLEQVEELSKRIQPTPETNAPEPLTEQEKKDEEELSLDLPF